LDILCKVVDNYGDIGVVFRLARALSAQPDPPRLRLVVDNLESFRALCPEVDPGLALQEVRGWTVATWSAPPEAQAPFRAFPPRLVVESFACGRPDWFEDLLFDPGRPERRLIVNLEYLTAETWADDFHLIPSLTRSDLVKKSFYLPGFSPATGGLILDPPFMEARSRLAAPGGLVEARRAILAAIPAAPLPAAPILDPLPAPSGGPAAAAPPAPEEAAWVTVFSYERDYGRIVADLAAISREGPLLALVAAGKSSPCFLAAWEAAGRPFPALPLPFLPQEAWDEVLLASDFSIVRGEDSLSRSALSGRPFLWQAYPQEDRHHLVKVKALLERLRPFLPPQGFEALAQASLAFNDRDLDSPDTKGEEGLLPLLRACLPGPAPRARPSGPGEVAGVADSHEKAAKAAQNPPESPVRASFRAFSDSLLAHGDLAATLLTLLRDFV
jgi:hypothetical protein